MKFFSCLKVRRLTSNSGKCDDSSDGRRSAASTVDDTANLLLANQLLGHSCDKLSAAPAPFIDVAARTSGWYAPLAGVESCRTRLQVTADKRQSTSRGTKNNFMVTHDNDNRLVLVVLQDGPKAASAVHSIATTPGGLTLNYRAGGAASKAAGKVFPSLSALIVHHTIMREGLGCLLVPGPPPAARRTAEGRDEADSCGESGEEEDTDADDFIDIDSDQEFSDIVSHLQKQLTF